MSDNTMLSSRPILIVEDELFAGLDIAEQLEKQGYVVYGPISNVKSAEKVIGLYNFSAAILDYQLQDGTSLELARDLTERGVPVIFYTGQPDRLKEAELQGNVTILAKPAAMEEIIVALGKTVSTTAE